MGNADHSRRSKSKERGESEQLKKGSDQENLKGETGSLRRRGTNEHRNRDLGRIADKKEEIKSGGTFVPSKSSGTKSEYQTVEKGRLEDTTEQTEPELAVVALSAAKPRNLLTTFSQSSETPEAWKATPSSQKKVTWQADHRNSTTQKTSKASNDLFANEKSLSYFHNSASKKKLDTEYEKELERLQEIEKEKLNHLESILKKNKEMDLNFEQLTQSKIYKNKK